MHDCLIICIIISINTFSIDFKLVCVSDIFKIISSAKSDHITTLAVQQTENKTRHFEAFWQNQSTHRRVWGDPGTPSVKLLIKDPTLDLCLLLPHLMRESLQRNTLVREGSVIYMHLKKYCNLPRNSKVVFSRLVMSVRSLTLRSIKDNLTQFSKKIK